MNGLNADDSSHRVAIIAYTEKTIAQGRAFVTDEGAPLHPHVKAVLIRYSEGHDSTESVSEQCLHASIILQECASMVIGSLASTIRSWRYRVVVCSFAVFTVNAAVIRVRLSSLP